MSVEHLWASLAPWCISFRGTLVFLVSLLLARAVQRRLCRLPPGPTGVPVLGYLPFLTSDIHLELTRLARTFGPVYKLYFGKQLVVVLSDHRVIRDAFKREDFSGRPQTQFTKLLDGYGIINSEGSLWKDQRKFLYSRLRQFGVRHMGNGREQMENRITREVERLLSIVARREGTATDMSSLLGASVSNVICSVLMSVRFHPEDPKFQRFLHLMDEGFELFTAAAKVNVFPFLRFFPGVSHAYRKLKENKDELDDFFMEIIDLHRQTFEAHNVRDLVDAYLLEFQQAREEGRERELFYGKNPERQLCQIMGDLFSAGQETVKTTLQWGILWMLHHPEVQKKVQGELDAVVGRTRLPALDDLPFLPYTEATILEIVRRSNVVGLGTIHATTRNTTLGEYSIPKDTQVLPLLWAVHMDPENWTEPEKFDPNRFLGQDGRVHKPEFFMPFGTGRRMCLGDVLARMEIFQFFASILHVFSLRSPPGSPLPKVDARVAATLTPETYRVLAVARDVQYLPQCDFREEGSSSIEILL